jgi:hypothetical protein
MSERAAPRAVIETVRQFVAVLVPFSENEENNQS